MIAKRVLVIVEDELATTINFQDDINPFYNALIQNPDVVRQDTFDVAIGDIYDTDTQVFTRNGSLVPVKYSPGMARFVFIKNNVALFATEIEYSNELLIAAFSSNPIFEEV